MFLVLWEVLPQALIINPLFTSYPSAIWPTFLDMLKSTPQQASILTHTWATVLATVVGFTAAMVLGHRGRRRAVVVERALQGARSLPRRRQRHAEDGVRADLLHLARRHLSIYGMSLAISLFITILMIYSGFQGVDPNKIKLAQTFGATKGQILTKVVLPGSVPTLIAALKVNAGLSLVGVVVGEFQSATWALAISFSTAARSSR